MPLIGSGGGYAVALPSRVQGQLGTSTSSSVTSIAVTLGATVGVGNALCGMVMFNAGAAPVVTITDNKNNTYLRVDNAVSDGAGNFGTSFYLINITNAPQTLTAKFSAAVTFTRIWADEFKNVAAVSALDGHGANGNTSAVTTPTSGTWSTATDKDLIWAGMGVTNGNPTITPGAGFSAALSGPEANVPAYSEFEIQSVHSASTTATFGASATSIGPVCAMALKHV